MKKDNLKSIIVLFSCCLVVALLLAAINLVTAPIIEENNEQARLAALNGLIPNADYDEKKDLVGIPESISGIFVDKNGGGVAITFSATSQYSNGPMQYAVGIDMDGKVISIKEIFYMESRDFGSYPDSFIGKEYADIDQVDAVGDVTYSSNAFKSGLKDAYTAFYAAIGGELKKTELDILNTLVEDASFKQIESQAQLVSEITAIYRANALTYAFRYTDGDNVYLVVADIFGKVVATAVYEGDENATVPTDFVTQAAKEIVSAEIVGKVLTDSTDFELLEAESKENTVKMNIAHTGERSFTARSLAVFKTADGYAVLVESQGYAAVASSGEPIVLAVGFDNDGKITKTHVISHAETQKFGGDKVINNAEYTDKYIGLDEIPDSVSGFMDAGAYATYSYTGYHNGVRVAYLALSAIISK